MTHLNKEQTERVNALLTGNGLKHGPLKEDLLDHICCQVEAEMASGTTFEYALQKSMDTFGEDEIKDLQSQTLLMLNQKKSIIMKVSIAALITILVVCTAVLVMQKEPANATSGQQGLITKPAPSAIWVSQTEPPDISPLKGNFTINSGFGFRVHPVLKVKKHHDGVDFSAPAGTTVYATSNGVVIKAEMNKGGYGNHIIIQHDQYFQTLYAQLSKMDVKVGQEVKKGEAIGAVGSSGMSTAPHLHYEVLKNGKHENPQDYMRP